MTSVHFSSTADYSENTSFEEWLAKFDSRIEAIANTLNVCNGQIQCFEQRLSGFESNDGIVEKPSKSKLKRLAERFNHIVEKLKKLLNACKKLLSLIKKPALTMAKAVYLASVPLALATAVIAPQFFGKVLTVMEKVKAVVVQEGSFADKLAALEQLMNNSELAISSSTDTAVCNDDDIACLAAAHNKQADHHDDKGWRSKTQGQGQTANAATAQSGSVGSASISSSSQGKAATDAKLSIAGKIVSPTAGKAESSLAAKTSNAKAASTANANSAAAKAGVANKTAGLNIKGSGNTMGKAANDAKISIAGKIVGTGSTKSETSTGGKTAGSSTDKMAAGAKDSADKSQDEKDKNSDAGNSSGLSSIIQSNFNNSSPDSPTSVDDAKSIATITQTSASNAAAANNDAAANKTNSTSSSATSNNAASTGDSSNTIIIINTDNDSAKALQTGGGNNYIQITQPGGQSSNVTQEGSFNKAVITQNQ